MTTDRPESYGPSALLTPANMVTLARLALSPVAFVLILTEPDQSSWLLCGLWFLLSISDRIDGELARRQGTTRSGAFLDPLADKVLALGGLTSMWAAGRFPLWPLLVVAVREVVISIFRSSFARRGLAVPASKLAKWKTFLLLAAVGWVTLPPTTDIEWLADITLWAGVATALVSGGMYLAAGSSSATTMSRE